MSKSIKTGRTLDIKGQVCPYTFVRSKLALEKLGLGEVLEIITDDQHASENVPRTMEQEGQKVLTVERIGDREWRIFVRKDREKAR